MINLFLHVHSDSSNFQNIMFISRKWFKLGISFYELFIRKLKFKLHY